MHIRKRFRGVYAGLKHKFLLRIFTIPLAVWTVPKILMSSHLTGFDPIGYCVFNSLEAVERESVSLAFHSFSITLLLYTYTDSISRIPLALLLKCCLQSRMSFWRLPSTFTSAGFRRVS